MKLTPFERLVITGLSILIRVQIAPRDSVSKDAHFATVCDDTYAWHEEAETALKDQSDD